MPGLADVALLFASLTNRVVPEPDQ